MDDHYTVQKAPSVGGGLVDSSQDSLEVDFVVAPHDLNVSPTVVANIVVSPSNVAIYDSIDAPHVTLAPEGAVVTLSCSGGTSSLAERALGDVCGLDDFSWQKAAGMVEDGWTKVKEKKVKPSFPSFDMSLCSQKTRSESKS